MAAKRGADPFPVAAARADPAVAAFLRRATPATRRGLEQIRRVLLAAGPEVREGIKWNAPSFRTTEWFATLNRHRTSGDLLLVLHTGAKAKGRTLRDRVPDPTGLLRWVAADRALVTFARESDVGKARTALRSVVRAWIRRL